MMPGRHNIGELALHHACWMHVVRGRLTGGAMEPFVLEGECAGQPLLVCGWRDQRLR